MDAQSTAKAPRPAARWRPPSRLGLLALGLTAIFIGYFLVWLPGPGAGLSLIGVEVGEWIKFLGCLLYTSRCV